MNSTLRETLKEVVVKFGNDKAENYSGNTDFTNEERLDLDETLTQLEALIQRKQLEALDLIAKGEGWEDSRDRYAAELGLPYKYTDRFHRELKEG